MRGGIPRNAKSVRESATDEGIMRIDEQLDLVEKIEAGYELLRAQGKVTWDLVWDYSNSSISMYTTIYTPSPEDPDDYAESYSLRISDHAGRGPHEIRVRIEESDSVSEVAEKTMTAITEHLSHA